MLTQEQAVEINVLARQGYGIKAIARELGLSRNTIRKYLRAERALPRTTCISPSRLIASSSTAIGCLGICTPQSPLTVTVKKPNCA